MKTVLNKVLGSYDVTQLNNNFDIIQKTLNEKVLFRHNPTSDANQMREPLDMNGQRIINLPAPVSDHEPVRKWDLDHYEGVPGPQGPQGEQGPAGESATPLYTWIRYADDEVGFGMSDDPSGKTYVGFAYNKTSTEESNNPADYRWSLIKGEEGVAGAPGADGVTTYTWIKYSDNADGTGMYDLPTANTAYIGIATNKNTEVESLVKTDYKWSKFRGDTGPQGVAGPAGIDGVTTYTWIRYADTVTGDGISNDPTGKTYIGLAYNKNTAIESNIPSDYTWALIQGPQGNQGVEGPAGVDGVTTYTWIKYSDNADGTGLYDIPTANTQYIGIATNKTVATESSVKTDYIWSKFKGDTGPQGVQGPAGADGISYYTWIRYADSSTGTGISNDPTGKTYIGFAYNKTTPTESSLPGDYTWSLIQGPQGNQGVPGTTTYTWIKYSDNADGTGLYDTPTATTQYIGIATNRTTATESTTKTDYIWSKFRGDQGVQGVAGANGVTYYTWIKYANDVNGTGLSDDPTGKTYIGFAYNKTTATESTTPTDYVWSLIQGPQGNQGVPGTTTYTWVKYSDVADGTGLYDTPTANTQYIGIATNKTTATESTVNTDYVWSKFKGDAGGDGLDGFSPAPTYVPVMSNENHTLAASSDGTVSSFAGAACTLTVNKGTSDDTANWTISKVDSGVTSTLSGSTATITAMPADSGYVDITAALTNRINIIDYPEQFNSWPTKSNVLVTSDATEAPDGTKTADKLMASTVNSGHYIDQRPPINLVLTGLGNQITWSVFVKKAELTFIRLQNYGDPTTSKNFNTTFDLTTKTIVGRAGSTGSVRVADGIQVLDNDWVRIWHTFELDTPDNKIYCRVILMQTATVGGWAGNNTDGLYLWGAMANQGGLKPYAPHPANITRRFTLSKAKAGVNAQNPYTWIKYAKDSLGTGMSDSPIGMSYVGFAANKSTAVESTNAADYTWQLVGGTINPNLVPPLNKWTSNGSFLHRDTTSERSTDGWFNIHSPGAFTVADSPLIKLEQSIDYTISFVAASSGPTAIVVCLLNATDNYFISTDPTPKTYTINVNSTDADMLSTRLRFIGDNPAYQIQISDVKLERGKKQTPWCDSSSGNVIFDPFSIEVGADVFNTFTGKGTFTLTTRAVTVTGGKGVISHQWEIIDENNIGGLGANIYINGSSTGSSVEVRVTFPQFTDHVVANVKCTSTDETGRSTSDMFNVDASNA